MTDEEAAETEGELLFVDKVVGGRIPKNFIPAIEKGFRNMLAKGPVAGFPVVSIKIELNDGKYHEVDSSDMAFMVCARKLLPRDVPQDEAGAARADHADGDRSAPRISRAAVVGNISARRGIVMSTDMVSGITKIIAEVPLAETFGYSTDLRSMTQGQGTFTMELAKYRPVPANIQTEVIAERKAELQPA